MPANAVLSEYNASEAATRASVSESVSGTRAFNPDPRSTSTEAPAAGSGSSNSSAVDAGTDGPDIRRNWRPSGACSVGRVNCALAVPACAHPAAPWAAAPSNPASPI